MSGGRGPGAATSAATSVSELLEALSGWAAATAGAHASDTRPARTAAEALVAAAEAELGTDDTATPTGLWHEYLDATGRPAFLQALPDPPARDRWARTAFQAIRASGYSLATLLDQRVRAHPDRVLLEDPREADAPYWTYADVARYARTVAGVFLSTEAEPRVALLCDNSVDGAVADLACLTQGILVTPLNVHTDEDTLAWIFERLDLNIGLTDTAEREARIRAACARTGRQVTVFRSAGGPAAGDEARSLRQACAQVDLTEVSARLADRRPDILAPATVMFTSGSTGQVKGVVFSQYMLVTKRFGRAAALPAVGDGEVLLCYLPLFHTFGRYLELLGMVYWSGTYVFAGNPSAEALITQLGQVRPTGLISVPVRWSQIRDHCLESMAGTRDEADEGRRFRQVVGDRLRWGLSAAGYLDPRVFRFFQRHGVDLCSGFGMTEATGGITMTPPGAYVDGTVGVPLPGMDLRLTEEGELWIAGEYVAEYLDPDGPPGSLPSLDPDADRWLPTGDLFHRHANGYLEIVDRIKDIYKNSRGQTVAPQRVEQRFAGVPGIRRTFLAGDHRDHNVLLIVQDPDDPVLAGRPADEAHEYFARVVASANTGLAPYERVVGFAVVDRDFEVDRGELTPKGSLRRKVIEENFAAVIEPLYRARHVELEVAGIRVRIPRWFVRDLGVLEEDMTAAAGGVANRRTGQRLAIAAGDGGRVRVGDLEYDLPGDLVDLGLFARQPRLWLGNPSLASFAPCKAGWELSLADVSPRVRLPRRTRRGRTRSIPAARTDHDRLRELHRLAATALFAAPAAARSAIVGLGEELGRADARTAAGIRRRLEALAFHPDAQVRALAYRTLLLDAPLIDYDTVFPAFIESGRSFLDEESIAVIATARRGERRLQALRQRMHTYRTELAWPASPVRRRQFRTVFRMLADYARHHGEDLGAVQAEFAAWALFDGDRALARAAQRHLDELVEGYERRLRETVAPTGEPDPAATGPEARIVFEYGLAPSERDRLLPVLADPTFLRASVARAFNEDGFSWDRVPADGVWVSPLAAHHRLQVYRLGINLVDGRHYDLLLVVGDYLRTRAVEETILWLTALSHQSFGAPTLPPFGTWRRDLGAATLAYLSDLTVWERIRELTSRRDRVAHRPPLPWSFRKLFVRALAAFFRAWEQSGYRIVPGGVTPSNVALPDADFHETSTILSIAGWRPYQGPLSLVRPMVASFYRLTAAHYPQTRDDLRIAWIFDACFEALGPETAGLFLESLGEALERAEPDRDNQELTVGLQDYRAGLERDGRVPLPVLCAVQRYGEWERANPAARPEAREATVLQMLQLYRLERFLVGFRYQVYRDTYFRDASDTVRGAFDRLVERCLREPRVLPIHLEELSTLQAALDDPLDRAVFSRMIFPRARGAQRLEVLAYGAPEEKRVVVRSELRDNDGARYGVRDPVTAAEVGHLYHLILQAGYPIRVAEDDRQLVLVDRQERVVGGLSYREEDQGEVAAVDGIVVATSLTNRGLGGRLLEDFCVRMAGRGASLVRTNFYLGGLFSKHGFRVDRRWGGLVRFL